MMERLRTTANSLVLKIIFGVIILSFILTGVGNYLVGGAENYAAEVNGQQISMPSFEQAVQGERNQQQQQLKEHFSELAGNVAYIRQMRQQVLDRMVNNMLLDQYAEKLGLAVSDDMIKDSIRRVPYFQTDGQFDNAKYLDSVARMGLSPDGYARYIRQQLVSQQVLQGYLATEFALPTEVDGLAALVMQSRDVRLATINVETLVPKQKVNDAELQAYYQKNSTQFVAPEQVKVSYIELDAATFSAKATVTEQDITAYYEQNKGSFTQAEQRNYRIIQLKTESDAQAVLKALHAGEDFGTLVKDKSTDIISRKADGYTNWMEQGSTPKEISQANLTEKGQLSGVIKSGEGYLVIRLEDIKPQEVKPLAAVHQEVADKLKQDKGLDAYYAQQQKLSEGAANDNESLATAAEAVGIKAQETDWFSRDNMPANLNFPQLLQVIFRGNLYDEKGNALGNSDVINVEGDRAFVVRVVAYQAEHTKPLNDVRTEVLVRVQREKAVAEARAEGEKLLAALNAGKGNEVMKAAGLTFADQQTLTRRSEDSLLVNTVFMLPHPKKGQVIYGLSQDNPDKVVVVALDTVQPGVLKGDEKIQFTKEVVTSTSGIIFESLLSNLRKEAKIEIGDAVLQR